MFQLLSKNYAVNAGLAINVVATIYASFNPALGDKLFTLYGITVGAYYGFANQSQQERILSDDRETDNDENDYERLHD